MEAKKLFQVSEVTIGYSPKVKPSERLKITCSKDANDIIKDFLKFRNNFTNEDLELRERVFVMLLNNANKVLGIRHIGDGGITGCIVDVRLVFQSALLANATSIILWHNHPTGNLNPSQADRDISTKLKKGGELLDIRLIDSLIIDSEGNYYSMMDNGRI